MSAGRLLPQSEVRRMREQFEREELMHFALLRDGVDDVGRARALRALQALWLRHRSEAARVDRERACKGLPPRSPEERARAVDQGLDDLFKGLGQRIMQADDPAEAAKKLFQPAHPRGRKVKHDGRDLALAVQVEKLRLGRVSLENAIDTVAGSRRPREDRIRQIYRAQVRKHGLAAIRLLARSGAAKLEDVRI
jgi:hypothetical protein